MKINDINQNLSEKTKLYFIFIFLIFFYNLYLTYLHYDPLNFFTGDGITYKVLSEKLFYEFKYYEDFPKEYPYRSWRTPGYPIFLFILKFVSVETANQLFILNQLFLLLSYLLLFKNLNLLNPKNYLINFYLITFLYICHINTQFKYYTHNHNEPLYIFLIIVGIYLITKAILKKKQHCLFIGLIILSFSCLVRTPTLPITTLILVLLFILSLFKKIDVSPFKIFIYFCVFYIFPLMWMIRNYYVLDYFPFFIGSQAGHILLGTFRKIDWIYIDNFAYDKIDLLKERFEVVRPKLITEEAISRILDNPIFYINTRIMNFLKYLIHNYSFFSLILLFYLIIQNIKIKKLFLFIKMNTQNLITIVGLLFSVIFLLEMSVTFHVPRYGLMPSLFIMFYCNILIIKVIEFKKIKKTF